MGNDTEILYDQDAQRAMFRGVQKLTYAVQSTLGPGGHNAIIDRTDRYAPQLTKDGRTVANHVSLSCPHEQAGVDILMYAINKAKDLAGDGSTTTCILAHRITREALKAIAFGANPNEIKRGILEAAEVVAGMLRREAITIDVEPPE